MHIDAFTRSLGRTFGSVDLLTIAAPELERPTETAPPLRSFARDDGVTHWPIHVVGRDMIARASHFRASLWRWWKSQPLADVAHVRSIFEGYPIARAKPQLTKKLVYEVNGLPSIELKYHFPRVAEDQELLTKLRAQESACFEAADMLVTPSPVTAAHLVERGVARDRIRVVPNGVDTEVFTYRAPTSWEDRPCRWIYTGTMTAWQGLDVAIEALRLYRRDFEATLTIVGPAKKKRRRQITDYCRDVGLGDAVTLLEPLSQPELAALYHQHDVAVVPLIPNDRNLTQGCCPLKLIEAMAVGVPVIASDLPVVTDLAEPDRHVLAVRPGSAKAIKDGVLRLKADPTLGPRIADAARQHVEAKRTWRHAEEALVDLYRGL